MPKCSEQGRQFPVASDMSAMRIPGFRPGVDTCRISVPHLRTTILADTLDDGVAVILSAEGEGDRTVSFPGLSMLPLADILLDLEVDGTRRTIALADLDAAGDGDRRSSSPPAKRKRPTTEFVLRPGDPIPCFASFSPGDHLIEVALPGSPAGPRRVEVRPSPDGRDGILMIDGKAAAVLDGAPSATPADIRVLGSGRD